MEDLTPIHGAFFGGGMALMYVLIFLIPVLMPKSWVDGIVQERKRARRKKDKERDLQRNTALKRAKEAEAEDYTVAIAQSDIDRNATLMVVEHVKDQVEDLKRHGHIRHLLKLSFLNWDAKREPLWRDQRLVTHVHKIYEEYPALPYFLSNHSVAPFFEILYTAEKGMPEPGVTDAPVDSLENFHSRFVTEAREFFESLSDNPKHKKRLDEIADKCVNRLEQGIQKIHTDRAKRMAAEKNEMDALNIREMETHIASDS